MKDKSGFGFAKVPNYFHKRNCLYIGKEGQ